jgi:hypothetical protein
METVKHVTAQQIREYLQSQIDQENKGLYLHNEIVKALKPFEGKPISKRIATALQKLHPDWTVFYDTNYGMFHLVIWGGDTGLICGNSFRALIGYERECIVSVDKSKDSRGFEEFDCCHGSAAIERNALRQSTLDSPDKIADITQAINDYSDALANLEKMIDYPMPDEHGLIRMAYNGKYNSWRQ